MLSAWGAVRLAAALRWWDVLTEFESSLSPLYLAGSGAVWCAAGGVLFWGVLTGRSWLRFALLTAAVLWYGQHWVERIYFQAARANVWFVFIATTLPLAALVIDLNLPSVKKYFMMSEEHEQANKPTETP